mmetsp:Transcript_14242/g.21925  ORF Transcript_14242/g.21925 Transcript_14242/m.21925 type:complete len:312 (-) Transcript_14242:146-1081(-)|eukprot:CAMPEP_0196815566 /NCGR_PEP_ID=MMETSP1362-20130617/50557_1 /TAXON_ID=163516 /ORGANISM="Leptocylindrus danicus, Strain CCMP1856" /LENGTH=311 /DNA_ID=CAMNT_0042192575 /DNA_START=209 /DNA_END=1144 /DNA_ORIENTATION=-
MRALVQNLLTWKLIIICVSEITALSNPVAESKAQKYQPFPKTHAPFLAVLTEPDAASSPMRRQETVNVFRSALSVKDDGYSNDSGSGGGDGGGTIDIISIRVESSSAQDEELRILVQDILQLSVAVNANTNANTMQPNDDHGSTPKCIVVVNDRVDIAVACQAHGVHVKEKDASKIGSVKKQLVESRRDSSTQRPAAIVGSSCHSVASAVRAAEAGADYLFVGTCFPTQTHPEKTVLEGPQLVGDIRKELDDLGYSHVPCLAIGGINETNCHIPVQEFRADGVAAIRSVTQAENPRQIVNEMKRRMKFDAR